MKQYTHAWLGLKALELLKGYAGSFNKERNKRLKRFLKFMSSYPSTFVRGAWFPDTIIKDNTQGGHTWKYYLDPVNGRIITYRPPSHNTCFKFVEQELGQKISLNVRTSDLPDRCEALGQTIRDTIKITNKLKRGDIGGFNDSQVAIFFLMLAHYICDAHVPVHCDSRDLYKPSKVHPDLEEFLEEEVFKYYRVSKRLKQFDLDQDQSLQRDEKPNGFEDSILGKCDEVLKQSKWANMNKESQDWRAFLGSKNNNFWDYLVSVCHVSFLMSLKMFQDPPPAGVDYNTVRIRETEPFKSDIVKYSPYILADAIHSTALVWLAAWERWELLKEGKR